MTAQQARRPNMKRKAHEQRACAGGKRFNGDPAFPGYHRPGGGRYFISLIEICAFATRR